MSHLFCLLSTIEKVLPYHIYLQFMSVDYVNLLENIVDIPHFDASVNARRHNAVPVPDRQCLQLNDSRKVRVQYFYQFRIRE